MNTENIKEVIEQLKQLDSDRGGASPPHGPPRPPLNNGGGGGKSPDMEARVAKLEALMEGVRADLGKLSDVPADLAGVKERLNHLPTKIEAKKDLDDAVDKLGTRVQRMVTIAGTLVGIVGVSVTVIAKLI